jgi:hypothetical protein
MPWAMYFYAQIQQGLTTAQGNHFQGILSQEYFFVSIVSGS